MKYSLVEQDGNSNITVLVDGELLTAASSHPNWDNIVAGVRADDPNVADLFDVSKAVSKRFERVTERVTLKDGVFYLDGDPIDNALTKQVLSFVDAGEDNYLPLVNFFEKILANPNEHSREQAFRWLDKHEFPIDDDGYLVAYKAVHDNGDGTFKSSSRGKAIVDGVEVEGQVPQTIGSVVEMPRSAVQHDPSVGCHTGLHAGTWQYASTFLGGAGVVLQVKIDPRDIVSVPTDCDSQKVRVCRYTVIGVTEAQYAGARYVAESDDEDYDDYGYDGDSWDDEDSWDYGDDDDEFEVAPVAATTSTSVGSTVTYTGRPTSQNYLNQPRDAKGHFIPKHRQV